MTKASPVAALGAGRMGRGIAIVFAYAGHQVFLIDMKKRNGDAGLNISAGICQLSYCDDK